MDALGYQGISPLKKPKNQKINEDIVYDLGTVALGYTCAIRVHPAECWACWANEPIGLFLAMGKQTNQQETAKNGECCEARI